MAQVYISISTHAIFVLSLWFSQFFIHMLLVRVCLCLYRGHKFVFRTVVNINDKSLESNQKCLYLNYTYCNTLNDMRRQMNRNKTKQQQQQLNDTKTEEMAHMIHVHIFFSLLLQMMSYSSEKTHNSFVTVTKKKWLSWNFQHIFSAIFCSFDSRVPFFLSHSLDYSIELNNTIGIIC